MCPESPFPKRALGQNFLVHGPTLERIAELACPDSSGTIVELGAGTGNLTRALAARCRRVIALEIDERLLCWHQEHRVLPENVELRRGDMLNISCSSLAEETGALLHIAGNLPYNISTQVVFTLCRQRQFVKKAFLLFQKEVADRIVSPPGSKSYGIMAVVAQYNAEVRKVLEIPPSMFRPRPRIYSSLVRFDFRRVPEPEVLDYELFLKTVKASFSQRRKKIINCLAASFRMKKPEMKGILLESGISPHLRAESLAVEAFVGLSNRLLRADTK